MSNNTTITDEQLSQTSTTISEIRLFIEKLRKDLPEIFDANGAPVKDGENAAASSDKTLYLGLPYIVRVEEAEQTAACPKLTETEIIMSVKKEDIPSANALLDGWMRARAQETLTQKVQTCQTNPAR